MKKFIIFPDGYSPIVAETNQDADYAKLGILWTYEDSREQNKLALQCEEIEIAPNEDGEYITPVGRYAMEGRKEDIRAEVYDNYVRNGWPIEDYHALIKGAAFEKLKLEETFEYTFSTEEVDDLYVSFTQLGILLACSTTPENILLNLPRDTFVQGRKYKVTIEEL